MTFPDEQKLVFRVIDLGSGTRIRAPFVDEELWEKMNDCDECGCEGCLAAGTLCWLVPSVSYAFYVVPQCQL